MSRFVLDSTALIDQLRGKEAVQAFLLMLLSEGHSLATTCVNIAEVERGLRPKERKAADALLSRLEYLVTTAEAARRAGRYQAEFRQQGRTLHTADALVAGTARAHAAGLITANVDDFPMRDLAIVKLG